MDQKRNLYAELGVPRDAGLGRIKKAYREKVKAVHPDKGGDHDAFIRLQQAFDTLSDEDARRTYDETGELKKDAVDLMRVALDNLVVLILQFTEKVTDPRRTNVLELVRQNIEQCSNMKKASAENLADQSIKFRKAAGRISRAKGENVLASALLLRADELEKSSKAVLKDIATGDMMLTVLGQFSYEVDNEDGFMMFGSTAFTLKGSAAWKFE